MKFVSAAHLTGGGTITGDLTISGDLTVSGGGGYAYSEVLTGDMAITNTATTIGLSITQSGVAAALFIDHNANHNAISIDAENTTDSSMYIESDALTTGKIAYFKSNSSSTGTRNLVEITNDNALATGTTGLKIQQDSTGSALTALGAAGSGSASGAVIKLQTAETTVVDGDYLGRIVFSAPSEASGTDAILAGAQIHAEADDTFGVANNETELVFSTASSDAELGSATSGALFERMRITSAGNVGIGVVPEAWNSAYDGLQIGNTGSIAGYSGSAIDRMWISANAYVDTSDGYWQYINTDTASQYEQRDGVHNFFTAVSGSADATITWVKNMVLDANSRISLSNNDAGADNTIFGFDAGKLLTSGCNENVIIGDLAMDAADGTESHNVAIGASAMGAVNEATYTADGNVAIGSYALTGGDLGSSVFSGNIAVGAFSLNDTGAHPHTGTIAIGYAALTALTSGTKNTAIGYQVMDGVTTALNNVAVGYEAMGNIPSGIAIDGCVAIGYNAFSGGGNTTAGANGTVAIGTSALLALTTGAGNIAIGYNALLEHTEGSRNLAIGYEAMFNTYDGSVDDTRESSDNIAIGYRAMGGAWTDSDADNDDMSEFNVAVGNYAMNGAMADANDNTAVGYQALNALTTGNTNVAIGRSSAEHTTTGTQNVAIGGRYDSTASAALVTNTVGSYNIAIGTGALQTANENDNDGTVAIGHLACTVQAGTGGAQFANATVAVGYKALTALTSGAGNTAVGYNALAANLTGVNNTVLGYGAMDGANGSEGNMVAIGKDALGNMDNNSSSQNIAIGVGAGDGIGGIVATNNIFIGVDAGGGTWTGSTCDHNVAIGTNAMDAAMTDSSNNTAIGGGSLGALTAGDSNIGIGSSAGEAITEGSFNTLVGYQCGDSLILTTHNTSMGADALSGSSLVDQCVIIGSQAGAGALTAAADGTVAVGYAALNALTSGGGNLAIGYDALSAQTDGTYNIAIGYEAMNAMDSGEDHNIGIGYGVMGTMNNAASVTNVAIGSYALDGTSTAAVHSTVAVGYGSMGTANHADVSGTTAIGYLSLSALTSGAGNTAVGFESQATAQNQGDNNTSVGYRSLKALDPASDGDGDNTAVGHQSGTGLTTAVKNTFVGSLCANGVTTGSANTAVGYQALYSGDGDEDNNTCIGYKAGDTINNGNNNTLLGYEADVDVATDSYQTRLGYSGALRYMTAQIEMADFTSVADNDAATAPLLKIPQFGFLKRVTCTVQTENASGTGEYNISLGTNVVAPGTAPAGRIELMGADDTEDSDFTGATLRSSTKSSDSADSQANIETAKHVHIWEANQATDDSSGWTLMEAQDRYLYVCHANASNAADGGGTQAVLRITAEYWGED